MTFERAIGGLVVVAMLAAGVLIYQTVRSTPPVVASIIATGSGTETPNETLTDYIILQERTGAGAHAALTAWIKAHAEWDLVCVAPITEPTSMQHWPGTSGLLVVARRRR